MKEFLSKNQKQIITYGGLAAVILIISMLWIFWDKTEGKADYTQGDYQESVTQSDIGIVSESSMGDESNQIVPVQVTQLIDIIESENDFGGESIVQRTQIFMVKINGGPYKGKEAVMTLDLTDVTGTGQGVIVVKVGDKLRGFFETDPITGDLIGTCAGFQRDIPLMWLAVGFICLLLLFFGRNGLKSFSALVITCIMLIFVMIPLVYYGMNPVLAVAIFGFATIIVTLLLVHGPSVSSLAAGCGAVGGVMTAAVIAYIMKNVIWITGTVDEDSINLLYTPNGYRIDVSSVMFAAIVIGSLGGTIDVSVSISSSLEELREKTEGKVKGWELVRSGMSIGRSIMGASLNTMILAYVGGSFELLMLFTAYYSTMQDIVNHELIALELLRSLAGCFGLLFTVPITSVVAAYFTSGGDMGKLDINDFTAIQKLTKFSSKLSEYWNKALINAASKADAKKKNEDEQEEIPNLFERAREHYDEFNIDEASEPTQELTEDKEE